jgi:hypothetical protein
MQINAIHITLIQIRMRESNDNDTFLRFLFSTKEKTKKKKRIDRSSIPPDCMRKMRVREAYVNVM